MILRTRRLLRIVIFLRLGSLPHIRFQNPVSNLLSSRPRLWLRNRILFLPRAHMGHYYAAKISCLVFFIMLTCFASSFYDVHGDYGACLYHTVIFSLSLASPPCPFFLLVFGVDARRFGLSCYICGFWRPEWVLCLVRRFFCEEARSHSLVTLMIAYVSSYLHLHPQDDKIIFWLEIHPSRLASSWTCLPLLTSHTFVSDECTYDANVLIIASSDLNRKMTSNLLPYSWCRLPLSILQGFWQILWFLMCHTRNT